MQQERLVISEMFYSLQGEGPSIGHPAIFLRLAGCNLTCEGFSYKDPTTQKHLGCDTKLVWQQGQAYLIDALLEQWHDHGWITHLQHGAHLVITGGEPLLQQNKITALIQALDLFQNTPYIEIETNATVLPNDFLSARVDQFNISPKLRSSKEPRDKAYQQKVLQHFSCLPQAIFKFVIQSTKDVTEVIHGYQTVFQIDSERIWLMPEGGTLAEMQTKMPLVAELCKKYYFNFSARLHIHIWNEATGV